MKSSAWESGIAYAAIIATVMMGLLILRVDRIAMDTAPTRP